MRPRARSCLLIALLLPAAAGAALWASSAAQARRVLTEARRWEREGLAWREVPAPWQAALLAVEDPAFFAHRGIDLETPGAGWTTITQGLVKLHFPGPRRGLLGKPLQSLRAVVLDRTVPKDLQLTLFLNTAYFGTREDAKPVVGFPAAAEAYYRRPFAELADREYLGLVAMLVGPDRFNPRRDASLHAERLRRIEALLAGRCRPRDWSDVDLAGCAAH